MDEIPSAPRPSRECSGCSRRFAPRSLRRRSRDTPSDPPYRFCLRCDELYVNSGYLPPHLWRTHAPSQ